MGGEISIGRTKSAACVMLAAITLTACDSVDYGTRKDNFNRATRKNDRLAFVNFDADTASPYAVNLNRDRTHRGYAIQAPLQGVNDVTPIHFTVSRTKEYRWFSGVQMSFNF